MLLKMKEPATLRGHSSTEGHKAQFGRAMEELCVSIVPAYRRARSA